MHVPHKRKFHSLGELCRELCRELAFFSLGDVCCFFSFPSDNDARRALRRCAAFKICPPELSSDVPEERGLVARLDGFMLRLRPIFGELVADDEADGKYERGDAVEIRGGNTALVRGLASDVLLLKSSSTSSCSSGSANRSSSW